MRAIALDGMYESTDGIVSIYRLTYCPNDMFRSRLGPFLSSLATTSYI